MRAIEGVPGRTGVDEAWYCKGRGVFPRNVSASRDAEVCETHT